MSKEKTKLMFMAFAAGKESTDASAIKRYIGVAPVFVLAVNPSKTKLEKLYGITLEKDPIYIGESITEVNGVKTTVPQIRIDFIVRTDPDFSNGIDFKTKISFFLNKEYKLNKDKTKVQVINKYGETTWLTIENAKNKVIPENLKWFDAESFRPAYVGEDNLVSFIRTYLCIPNKSYRDSNGVVHTIENKDDAVAQLEHIDSYFNGDVSELEEVLTLQPKNKIKVMFGVKTADDNKLYQTIYTQKFLKNNAFDYTRLDADLQERKNNGAYSNVEFDTCKIKEYSLQASKLDTSEQPEDMPDTDSFWNK